MKNIFIAEPACKKCQDENCLFRHYFSQDAQIEMLEHKRQINYRKGESIIKYGSFANNIFYVKKGLVKILVDGVNDKQAIFRLAATGELLEFSSLLTNEDYYPFSAVAMKDTQICVMQKEYVELLVLRNPQFAHQLLSQNGENFNLFYHRIASFSTSQTPGRLAQTLLYLNEPQFVQENVFEYITRREIAELGGMSLDSALKLLNELKNDKLIQIEGKHITIADWDMIRRLARIG